MLQADENAAAPQNDKYTLIVRTDVAGITGFKLDVLTDPSLPGTGPGRGNDKRPNFVLNDLSVTAAKAGSGDAAQPIKLRNARASFEQRNFGIEGAIDSDPATGWAINPQFFRDHWAIVETTAPIGSAEGTKLTFIVDQHNGGGRTIGRFRITALTGNPGADAVPADILETLRMPAEARTDAHEARLCPSWPDPADQRP